jgi:hypothetical protein
VQNTLREGHRLTKLAALWHEASSIPQCSDLVADCDNSAVGDMMLYCNQSFRSDYFESAVDSVLRLFAGARIAADHQLKAKALACLIGFAEMDKAKICGWYFRLC